jgi:hypothetical protein
MANGCREDKLNEGIRGDWGDADTDCNTVKGYRLSKSIDSKSAGRVTVRIGISREST